MATVVIEKRYTPEDLLAMDGPRFELIDGQLVEKTMGAKAGVIAARLIQRLANASDSDASGFVLTPDCGYRIFDDPDRVRFMDGSFIRRARVPEGKIPDGHMRVAPDLGIEVVSPNNTADEMAEKILEYQQAGVELIWVVYPKTRQIFVYRKDGKHIQLTENDVLTADAVLPSFTCPVADIFAGV